jgi:hypothetical protein
VFSYLLFSVQWFALFPLFRRYLLQYSPIAFHALTVILFLSGVACIAWIGRGNWLAGAVWGGLVGGGVGIGCPLGLIWLQKYKKCVHLGIMLMIVKYMVHGMWRDPNLRMSQHNESGRGFEIKDILEYPREHFESNQKLFRSNKKNTTPF